MKNANPLFDAATHYKIVVQGRVDAEWLRGFDSSAEIKLDDVEQSEDISVFNVHTDQSGIIGLVRKLHGLGLKIQQLHIISFEEKASEGEDQ